MATLLFVNACMRSPQNSRTYQLCNAFLEEFQQHNAGWTVETVNLSSTVLPPFTEDMVNQREALIEENKLSSHPTFELARQFAAADKIVVGAPFWDLSFPATLKLYVEHISVRNLTFRYTDNQLIGLCNAEKLIYLTTGGGQITGNNYGYTYIQGLCKQFGITGSQCILAEYLDVVGNDVSAIMAAATEQARITARDF